MICAYKLELWERLGAAVASVRSQTRPALEIFVVIDGDDELERRARAELDGVEVLRNAHARGLSGGRQTGADHARGSILAFLDDDAVAESDWLERLVAVYDDPRVLGVGGLIEPVWEQAPPRWFPAEFNWVVGCTIPGLASERTRIRNPVGANMSLRASVLAAAGGFDPRFGRAPGARQLSGSAEETELSIRVSRENPGHYWIHEPAARVLHSVAAQRGSWRYFVRRCVVEGTAKASLSALAGSDDGLRSEREYVSSLLPRALLREIGCGARGDRGGFERAAAMLAGLVITTGAYLRARWLPGARPG